jgi:hypothetical protein
MMNETQLEKLQRVEMYVTNVVSHASGHIRDLINSAYRDDDNKMDKEDRAMLYDAYNAINDAINAFGAIVCKVEHNVLKKQ